MPLYFSKEIVAPLVEECHVERWGPHWELSVGSLEEAELSAGLVAPLTHVFGVVNGRVLQGDW